MELGSERRRVDARHVLAQYLTELLTLLTTTTPGGTQEGGAALTKTVGWVDDAITDYYCAMAFEEATQASFGRHCTVFVATHFVVFTTFMTKALCVYMLRDDATRCSWDEALGTFLNFLNDFRDAHKDGVRKLGWHRWLAISFVEHHGKVGAKVYHSLVLCMTNAYYKDKDKDNLRDNLRDVEVYKHDLVQGLRKHPDGLGVEGVRDASALCAMLEQLL
jgi:hypothetical protein